MKNLLVLLFVLLCVPAFAQEPIDAQHEACMDAASNAGEMTECYVATEAAWDKELNANYKKLMAVITKAGDLETKAIVLDAQRKWLAFREANVAAEKVFLPTNDNHWNTVGTFAPKEIEMLRSRALELKDYCEMYNTYNEEE
jgi:uncharacterized protein YecT (DUF1311 family)